MTNTPPRKGRAATATGGPETPPLGPTEQSYTIGALAEQLGVTTRAIRFYEARGLIAPVRKGVARTYTRRDRARLMLILRGKNLGFTLEDIKAYLELYDSDPKHIAQMQMLKVKVDEHIKALAGKRADIERTLKELQDIRADVDARLAKEAR